MRHRPFLYVIASLFLAALASCSEETVAQFNGETGKDWGDTIRVGVTTDELTVSKSNTRATEDAPQELPAEQVSWLVQPLKQGLDITYGKVDTDPTKVHEGVAILKLTGGTSSDLTYDKDAESGFAKYTFNYRGTDGKEEENSPARWYGNGPHYFEGVHVPNRLRYVTDPSELSTDNRTVHTFTGLGAVTNLTTNQSNDTETGTDNDLGNYILLSHYLGMPANTRISATVGRILLPFRHRLARVIVYVLIDPSLGSGVTLKGYDITSGKDDATTTSLKFGNVSVLAGVKDVYDPTKQLHTLTPTWTTVRKAIPHFVEQEEKFVIYEGDDGKVYPRDDNYEAVAARYTASGEKSGYVKTEYQNVPVYDLIVRPTYTSEDMVMYDEDLTNTTKADIAKLTNQISFELELNNGLSYAKTFTFDLDANYETAVYLQISPERVDYNDSGSELWQMSEVTDDWYGLDNTNGHRLSKAGSTWQRAFRCGSTVSGDDNVTDGGFYNQEGNPGDDGINGQYLNETTWKKYFLQAYKGGAHHGDYFILDKDITINASELPADFVFTGHLDAFDPDRNTYHTITVTNGEALFKGLDGIYTTKQETDATTTNWEANVHKETNNGKTYWIPYKDDATSTGWRAEVINLTVKGAKLFSDGATITGHVENCKEGTDGSTKVTDHIPAIPKY